LAGGAAFVLTESQRNYIKPEMSQKEPQIVTFGCRLNTYESEVMRAHAKKAGMDEAIIFNTCAVTSEAERQARQAIRRARRDNPGAKIVVTGCAAQIDPDRFAAMEEVDQVIGNDLKLKEETWGTARQTEKILVNDIMAVKETAGHLIEGVEGHARAFIQVQNGCDHRCTFCIIPYGRGNSRSVPMGEIAEQVRKLVGAGYNEIVFSGVDVTSYGADLPGQPKLGQMIKRVLAAVPELPRLRLSSLDPVEMDEDLWRLIGDEPRLMPHDAIEMCRRARALRPDIVFGADIIAGFPTETDEMFENTLRAVEECDLTFLHIFPYSPRPGTPAAKMPQVEKAVIKERAARLRAAGERQMQKFLRFNIKKQRQVIVENGNIGRTEHFAPVRIDEDLPLGALAQVQITGVEDDKLTGALVHTTMAAGASG